MKLDFSLKKLSLILMFSFVLPVFGSKITKAENLNCTYDQIVAHQLCVVIGGYVKNEKGKGIRGVAVRVQRDDGKYKDVVTDSTGAFSVENFIPKNRSYAVRIVGNLAEPRTAPHGYDAPATTVTEKWVWDFCTNNRDIPVGSWSYECQIAGSGSSCADANPSGLAERCDFVYRSNCELKVYGDGDCNKKINLLDFNYFLGDFVSFVNGKTDSLDFGDFNSDGAVNLVDYNAWRESYFKELNNK